MPTFKAVFTFSDTAVVGPGAVFVPAVDIGMLGVQVVDAALVAAKRDAFDSTIHYKLYVLGTDGTKTEWKSDGTFEGIEPGSTVRLLLEGSAPGERYQGELE